jgi:hypothetical protein
MRTTIGTLVLALLTPLDRALSTQLANDTARRSCTLESAVTTRAVPPTPKDIAGIEVYAGPATIPPHFAGGRSSCGVVVVWTRYGP